jgi:hypothetical protein
MPWRILERKIGKAGGIKRRTARQREWDRKYGDWAIGYVIDGKDDAGSFPARKKVSRYLRRWR